MNIYQLIKKYNFEFCGAEQNENDQLIETYESYKIGTKIILFSDNSYAIFLEDHSFQGIQDFLDYYNNEGYWEGIGNKYTR